jgi:hypothetical protein
MRIHSKRLSHGFIGDPLHEFKSIHWTIIFDEGDLPSKELLKFRRTEVNQHNDKFGVHHYFNGCRSFQFRPEHCEDKVKIKIMNMINDFLLANDSTFTLSYQPITNKTHA